MNSADNLDNLMRNFSDILDIPVLELDEENRCNLVFDEVTLSFEISPNDESVYIYSYLGNVAASDSKALLAALLDANYLFRDIMGSTLGVDETSGRIVLIRSESMAALHPTKLESVVLTFVNLAEYWQNKLAEIKEETRKANTAPAIDRERPTAAQVYELQRIAWESGETDDVTRYTQACKSWLGTEFSSEYMLRGIGVYRGNKDLEQADQVVRRFHQDLADRNLEAGIARGHGLQCFLDTLHQWIDGGRDSHVSRLCAAILIFLRAWLILIWQKSCVRTVGCWRILLTNAQLPLMSTESIPTRVN